MKTSSSSCLAKFFYRTLCARCAPESIRIDQAIKKQIAIDLLYTYDPFQKEVKKNENRLVFNCLDMC